MPSFAARALPIRPTVALALSWLLIGCGEAAPRGAGEPTQEAPALAMRPALTIGAGAGAEAFGRIQAVVADAGGRIYVADALASGIRVFEADGRPAGVLGRAGEGPGEFGALRSLGWHHDSLAVLDANPRRVTLFDPRGGEPRIVAWPDSGGQPRALLSAGDSLYAVGTVFRSAGMYANAAAAQAAYRQPTLRYFRLGDGGSMQALAAADTLTEPPAFDCDLANGAIVSLPPLLGPTGPLRSILPGGALLLARPDTYRLDLVSLQSGDTLRTRRREHPVRALDEPAWERAKAAAVAELGGMRPLCDLDSRRPPSRPVIRSVTSDERGRIWVEAAREDGLVLAAFDPGLGLLGEGPLPERDASVPLHVRDDRLYLVVRDALDVQSVRVLQLEGLP